MASTVDGLPVGVVWVAPSHDHVIVATGFPPCMVQVRVNLLHSIIGPTGVCVILGNVVGWSKILKLSLHNYYGKMSISLFYCNKLEWLLLLSYTYIWIFKAEG